MRLISYLDSTVVAFAAGLVVLPAVTVDLRIMGVDVKFASSALLQHCGHGILRRGGGGERL